MNILVVSGYWPTSRNSISGIFVAQQIAALVRCGVRVTLLVPTASFREVGRPCSFEELGIAESSANLVEVRTFRFPARMAPLPGVVATNARILGRAIRRALEARSQSEKFDACIVHGLREPISSLPYWRHCVRGKVVLIVHGEDPFFEDRTNIMRAERYISQAMSENDEFVVVGNRLVRYLKSFGVDSVRVSVIPNGTDLPAYCDVTDYQRPITDTRKIVSVSNLIEIKGIDDNLRALARIALESPDIDWEYRIIGDGIYRSSLQELSHQLGLSERVRFLGRLSYQETMSEVEKCDVFSLPSWAEAFGIVYLEAMARMRPTIGCTGNGAADIIEDYFDGFLVPPRSPEALSAILKKLLRDPVRCGEIGFKARQKAENFSWDTNAVSVLEILQ
ncbi:glycosyltransferase [Kaistia sp. UC242_56]|uniref:glycosyltransferase n=1 Tax=Kaistia sp. UC242_56 TaxID=3374625 RepID=UPI0037A3AFEF